MTLLRRLRERVAAGIDALFDPRCPHGEWPAAECQGCYQDDHWVGSDRQDHGPRSYREAAR